MATSEEKQVLILKYVLIDEEEQIVNAISEIKKHNNIALDCEGINLSRDGQLTILSVATKEQAFIFDIQKLERKPFDLGLREILEDDDEKKLMFDCRNDSDALWHQFQVKLNGVLDVQLMEILYREEECEFDIANTESMLVRAAKRRGAGVEKEEAIHLHSLKKVIEIHLDNEEMLSAKTLGSMTMVTSFLHEQMWSTRPLTETVLEYASVDVLSLFKLFEKFKEIFHENAMSRILTASAIYTSFYRDKPSRNHDEYEQNGYLPMRVIPGMQQYGGFVEGSTKCDGCERMFPGTYFSATQIRKGTPFCPLCKKLKWKTDEQRRYQDWYESLPICTDDYDSRYDDILKYCH